MNFYDNEHIISKYRNVILETSFMMMIIPSIKYINSFINPLFLIEMVLGRIQPYWKRFASFNFRMWKDYPVNYLSVLQVIPILCVFIFDVDTRYTEAEKLALCPVSFSFITIYNRYHVLQVYIVLTVQIIV